MKKKNFKEGKLQWILLKRDMVNINLPILSFCQFVVKCAHFNSLTVHNAKQKSISCYSHSMAYNRRLIYCYEGNYSLL